MKPQLTEGDYARAATRVGCDVPAIKAVTIVEAPRGGFGPDDKPTILFERHVFSRLTGGVYDKSAPDISNPKPGGYGGTSTQHDRLAKAALLDRDAALSSASWGKFQIMGFNYTLAGFTTLQAFVNAMYEGEPQHLDAFIAFVLHEGLGDELREHRWSDFARRYNGVNYAINRYDEKLAAAFRDCGGVA